MMDKPTPLKAVEDATPLSEDRMKKADEAFSRFQALQVDSKVMVGARQIITTCSVRRPKNNEFVRVSENPELFTGLVIWAAGEIPPNKITSKTTKWDLEGRYMDKRGSQMWTKVMGLLADAERVAA
jgi:hypothetical protein